MQTLIAPSPLPFESNASTTVYPSLRQSWWLLTTLIFWQIAASIPFGLLKVVIEKMGWFSLAGLPDFLVYVASFGLTIAFGMRKRRSSTVRLGAVKGRAFPLVLVGTIALAILLEPLTASLPVPVWMEKILASSFTKSAIWTVVLAAPILEEVLFRGVILDGFLKQYNPAKAIVWSAVLFGIIHLNPAQAVGGFLIGLALGWLYYRTQSLWLCIFLHFVNNALSSIPLLYENHLDMSANLTRTWLNNDTMYMGLLVATAIIAYVCYYFLNRILPTPKTK
ncbi:CPBP family intramembrane glutamic endopeptidase [Tellurirhabdus bombi]|uniref:CPBP family intramembrane glutamic endopeptidase n=1 Tax=Tellurirhabdus bombi TaxID=2907205 RepID=UPI001F3CF77C|nr:type II CAAX endopeptidase family protein [Tellurirhabdus bombi]